MKWSGLIALMAIEGILLCAGIAVASRNSSGTYSLPTPGVPFQSNQTISSTQVNNTLNDIATTLTNSLDRNGNGGMLAALRGIDGTVAAPAFSWTSETGSGLFRNASNDVRMSIGGTAKEFWSTAGVGVGGAATNLFDVVQSGSASTVISSMLEASLSDGNFVQTYLGKAAGTGTAGVVTYTKNATAANSTFCLGVYGGSASTLCVDGNSKTYIGSTGTAISASYACTVSWTPGALASQGTSNNSCTVTGAAAGDVCIATPPGSMSLTSMTCYVTASTCNLNIINVSSGNSTPASGTYACRVFRP